jgi:hypothetical protein
VDLGGSVVLQKAPGDQQVVYHLPSSHVEQGVTGRFGDGVLVGNHDSRCQSLVARVLHVAPNRLHRHFVEV